MHFPTRRAPFAGALAVLLAFALTLVAAPTAQAAGGDDSSLAGLSVSAGTLSPSFSSVQTSYAVTVPHTTTSMTFTPTASDPGATIATWNGDVSGSVASGSPVSVTVRPAGAIVTTTVTSADGVSSTQYTIIITKQPAPPTDDPRLSGLTVSTGTLSPAFDAAVTSYTVALPYATTSITFGATALDGAHTVSIVNAGTSAVGATMSVPLVGVMALIHVTAPDTTVRTYTVHVTRAPAPTANVDLDLLQLSAGTLTPAFDPAVTSYTATVAYAVRSLQITASPAEADNTMVINNAPMADGVPSTGAINYNGGSSFAIRVIAPNGVEKIYNVQITRDPPSNNADLTGLSLSDGTLSPSFSNAETAYAAEVPYLTTSITVTPTVADTTAIARVNGHDTVSGGASQAIPLSVGANSITVAITAEDGVTTTSRTITVTRAAPDLRLADLAVGDGALSPSFDSETDAYTLTVPYLVAELDVEASAVVPAWVLEIDGVLTDASTIPLAVGTRTVTITVTALYGESRDYTITVTRGHAPVPGISFPQLPIAGQPSAGMPVSVTGVDLLPGSTATLTVHSTPRSIAMGTVTGGATVTLSGVLPAGLEAGAHSLVFDGVAQDGSAVSGTVWFTVMRNGTIGAVSLTGPVAYTEAALAMTGADAVPALAGGLTLAALGALLLLTAGARRRIRRA